MSGSDAQPRPFSADRLTAALTEVGGSARPDYLDDIVTQARRTRQRPAWTFLERWLPMSTSFAGALPVPLTRSRPTAWAFLLVVLLGVALAAGALLVASNLLRSDMAVVLPPMIGPAGNGLIAVDGGGDIWVVEPDDSARRQLTSGPELDMLPSWSPDGTRLAFWSVSQPDKTSTSINDAEFVNAGSATLSVMDADGRERQVIASDLTVDWDFGTAVTWAPDGRRLAYSHLEDDMPVIEVVDLDDLGSTRLSVGWSPSWSPQGSLIAYRGAATESGVWVVAPDGSGARQVTRTLGSGYAFTYPQWSLDGSLITFYAGPDGSHDVWVARTDGSDEWVIGDELVEEYWPSFSPDGTRVAFGRNIGSGCCEYRFVVSDPDGADQLMLEPGPFGPSTPNNWSPDGHYLLAVQMGEPGKTVLELVDASGEAAGPNREIEVAADWVSTSWQRIAAPEDDEQRSPDPSLSTDEGSAYEAIMTTPSEDVVAVDAAGRSRTLASLSGRQNPAVYDVSASGPAAVWEGTGKAGSGSTVLVDLADPDHSMRDVPQTRNGILDDEGRFWYLGSTGDGDDARSFVELLASDAEPVRLPASDGPWDSLLPTRDGRVLLVQGAPIEPRVALVDADDQVQGPEIPEIDYPRGRRWLSPTHGSLWVCDNVTEDNFLPCPESQNGDVVSRMSGEPLRRWYSDKQDLDRVLDASWDAEGTAVWVLLDRRAARPGLVLTKVTAAGDVEEVAAFPLRHEGYARLAGFPPDDSLVMVADGSAHVLVDAATGSVATVGGTFGGFIQADVVDAWPGGAWAAASDPLERIPAATAPEAPVDWPIPPGSAGSPAWVAERGAVSGDPGERSRTEVGPITLDDAYAIILDCNGTSEVAFDIVTLEESPPVKAVGSPPTNRCMGDTETFLKLRGDPSSKFLIGVTADQATAWRVAVYPHDPNE